MNDTWTPTSRAEAIEEGEQKSTKRDNVYLTAGKIAWPSHLF